MTQVRPNKMMNRMHGDNLGQLRYAKKAEVSPRVTSFNMASTAELIKKVRLGFREQRLNVERISKGQTLVYRDLVRLEQVKRKLMREALMYRQEDARLEVLRIERERKINQIMAEYDAKHEEVMAAFAQTNKKRKRKVLLVALPPEPETVTSPEIEYSKPDVEIKAEMNTIQEDEGEIESENKNVSENEKKEKKIERTRSSKALEVSIGRPKTLIKSESQEEFELRKSNEDANEDSSKSPEGKDNDDASIAIVKKVNLRTRRLSVEKQGRLILPSISENNGAIDADDIDGRASRRHSHNSDEQQKTAAIFGSTSGSENSKKAISNKEYVKRLRERRDQENRKALDEPYQIYHEDEQGKIVPMISPNKPFNNDVPTNRPRYERDKILEKQYKTNAQQKYKLDEFYERIKRPDTPDLFPMLMKRKKKISQIRRPKLKPIAAAALLPSHLQAAGELPAYVRETDLDDMRAAKERGDKRSCWTEDGEPKLSQTI